MTNGTKIVIALGAVLALDYLYAQTISKPRLIVKDKLPFNYNAQTVPPFGIFVTKGHVGNSALIQHELVHWNQYRKTGAILFTIKYLYQKSKFGYDAMPMEVESRLVTGENAACIYNYTQCVRNGQSLTITNPNFRNVS